jgi:hypothetical protein
MDDFLAGIVAEALTTEPKITALNMRPGDCFTIPGYYSINPITGEPTGRLYVFVVGEPMRPERTVFDHYYMKVM